MDALTKSNEINAKVVILIATLLIILVLITVLFMSFAKNSEELSHTKFKLMAQQFSEGVNFSRLAWIRQGKPQYIALTDVGFSHPANGTKIRINNHGWPAINKADNRACQLIWLQLLAQPLDSLKEKISASFKQESGKSYYCHYSLSKDVYFKYYPQQGAVINFGTLGNAN